VGPARSLADLLASGADRRPDAIALEHGDRSLTYAELDARAGRLAALLRRQGLATGDRIGLLYENSFEYVVGFFGILRAGACCVALNDANRPRTTADLLADSGAVGLVARGGKVARDLPALKAGAPDLRFVVLDAPPTGADHRPAGLLVLGPRDVADCPDTRATVPTGREDLAAIVYTSGSTGRPRGVTLTHGNLLANTEQILAYLDLTADDSVLCILPFHYSYGMSLLLTHVAVTGRLVIDNRFAFPASVVDRLQTSRVTGFSGVPSTFAILTAKTDFLARPWPHLRYLTQAGGPMAPALTRRLLDRLPDHVRLFIMYGQTEASPRLSWLPPDRLRDKLGSIGRPIPGVELVIRRPDGSECAPGEVGEVVASGDNIMRGYWNDPEETALVLKPDGLHTGDLGRRDDEGYIWLVDRLKNMIKTGANRVSPKEIENTIAEVGGVVEVCVVGVSDELLGEAIEAFVVPAPDGGPDERTILAHCNANLAAYKLPRRVHFREALPKNAAGKVVKRALLPEA